MQQQEQEQEQEQEQHQQHQHQPPSRPVPRYRDVSCSNFTSTFLYEKVHHTISKFSLSLCVPDA